MHRYILTTIVTAMLLLGLFVNTGCPADNIDWGDVAKQATAQVIGNLVRDTFDRYSDDKYKDDAIDWVMDELEDIDWVEPYLKLFNARSLAEFAWDQMWERLYFVARGNGMDVDADGDTKQLYSEFVQVSDFPGLIDKMVSKMNAEA